MWFQFARTLRCPLCASSLELTIFDETRVEIGAAHTVAAHQRGLFDSDFNRYVEAGAQTCARCRIVYPIVKGLPVMLPYTTALHHEFARDHAGDLAVLRRKYRFASRDPAPCEQFVLSSFSTEWLDYEYDGTIWEMDYADHERRFLAEIGPMRPKRVEDTFLELGCGIGITTALAQKNFGGDAVGVDLSLAALSAARHYRDNPFLHFVQGSVFYLPFAPDSFDTIYSRGVLHHTYSTAAAFRALARYCAPGGALYLWVYGPKSINDNAFRRGVYVAERLVRGVLSSRGAGVLSASILTPIAIGYIVFNRMRRSSDPTIMPYNYRRALHAARDRFTPQFAHRHEHDEVIQWFRDAGFEQIEAVDWRTMPTADHDDYRRNTGVRGRKAPVAGLSQISGVDGSLGMRPTLSLCRRGAAHDPECDCQEAEAPVQGRLQGPPLRGTADPAGRCWYLRYPLSYRDIEELFVERPAGRPQHPEPLGPGLCAADRTPAAVLSQAALRVDSH